MPGMFDDLIPDAQAPAPPQAPQEPTGKGMFDDLIPQKPSINAPEYPDFIAKKHGVAPDYAKGLLNSQTSTSAVEGIPILGGLAKKAEPYISSIAQPLTGAGAEGVSVADRATKNRALEDEISGDFKREHPGLDMAAQLIGGTAATAPLAVTATGAKLLGLGGETLVGQVARGAASGAGIGTLDAAVRGNDIGPSAALGAGVGGAAPVLGRAIGAAVQGVRNLRQPAPIPANEIEIAGVKVPRTLGETTGDFDTIRMEQAALRGGTSQREQQVAQDFYDQRGAKLGEASDAIAKQLDPQGRVIAEGPQDAAALVSRTLQEGGAQDRTAASANVDSLAPKYPLPHPLDSADVVANSLRTAREGQNTAVTARNTQIGAERENIRASLHPEGQVIARSPQEAADIISGAVGNQSETAQAARDAAYQQLRDMPGTFHPATFNKIGDVIRGDLNGGTEPIRINPQTTPIANHAINDLDEILGAIKQSRDELGRVQARPPITPALLDDTRKRLNSFLGDAMSSARSSNNFSDVRAMRGVVNAFDDHVVNRLEGGTFRGDASNVLETMQNARALHSQYRRTFTPQGPGDTVGSAVQNIVGRYDGQAAPPAQIAQWLYGQGALPTKIAQRLLGIFGQDGPEASALRQGYLSHLIERPEGVTAWGPNQIADRIFNALNGPGKALSEIYLPAQARTRLQNYATQLRGTVETAPEATDVVGRAINRIVGEGGQPASSAEVADTLFGRSSVGTNPLGLKLAQHVRDTQGADSPAFKAIKGGLVSRLTDAVSGPQAFDHGATATRIRDFLSDGRRMAETAFSPEERAGLKNYADALEQHAAVTGAPKDELGRAIAKISGRDGSPATPTEVADMLYGRSGAGDRGVSVRLAQHLKNTLGEGSEHWSAIRQGLWSRLTEPAEGKTTWGPQKISERISEFLNGNGKPLAHVMLSEGERGLMSEYAKLLKQLVPPPGSVNYSNTAPTLIRLMKGSIDGLFSVGGFHIGGPAGLMAGVVAHKAQTAMQDAIKASRVARSLYGTPQSAKAEGRLQQTLSDLAAVTSRGAEPAFTH